MPQPQPTMWFWCRFPHEKHWKRIFRSRGEKDFLHLKLVISIVREQSGSGTFTVSPFQFNSVTQSCLTLCNPMDCSMPGFPVNFNIKEFGGVYANNGFRGKKQFCCLYTFYPVILFKVWIQKLNTKEGTAECSIIDVLEILWQSVFSNSFRFVSNSNLIFLKLRLSLVQLKVQRKNQGKHRDLPDASSAPHMGTPPSLVSVVHTKAVPVLQLSRMHWHITIMSSFLVLDILWVWKF